MTRAAQLAPLALLRIPRLSIVRRARSAIALANPSRASPYAVKSRPGYCLRSAKDGAVGPSIDL